MLDEHGHVWLIMCSEMTGCDAWGGCLRRAVIDSFIHHISARGAEVGANVSIKYDPSVPGDKDRLDFSRNGRDRLGPRLFGPAQM